VVFYVVFSGFLGGLFWVGFLLATLPCRRCCIGGCAAPPPRAPSWCARQWRTSSSTWRTGSTVPVRKLLSKTRHVAVFKSKPLVPYVAVFKSTPLVWIISFLQCVDSNPYVFCESRIRIRHYLYGAGSFHQQAKKSKKKPCFLLFFNTFFCFLSWKTDVNIPSKSNP
jgi:hypothetical protein